MTPPFQWVCLLALVGCAVSAPAPFAGDACALLCHPVPRSFPEGVCEFRRIQSGSVLDQARIIVCRCLKLCDHQQSFTEGFSCHALISLLGSQLGSRECRCSSYPISTNAEISSLVNKLAEDVVLAISSSSPSLKERLIRALQATLLDYAQLENVDVEAVSLVDDSRSDRLAHEAEDVKLDRDDIEQHPMDIDDEGAELPEDDRKDTSSPSDSSEESAVDWEQWCMSQCNNGHGGNACRCDLIPWRLQIRGGSNGEELVQWGRVMN